MLNRTSNNISNWRVEHSHLVPTITRISRCEGWALMVRAARGAHLHRGQVGTQRDRRAHSDHELVRGTLPDTTERHKIANTRGPRHLREGFRDHVHATFDHGGVPQEAVTLGPKHPLGEGPIVPLFPRCWRGKPSCKPSQRPSKTQRQTATGVFAASHMDDV